MLVVRRVDDNSILVAGVALGAGVPAVVAPPALYFVVRLAARLDTAGQLLRRAALTDPLTSVLNRRGFFESVEEFERSGSDAEVAMIDIDHFKRLNDRHGHAVGDGILERVAGWLTTLAGERGVVARMGGDEFALVLPATSAPQLPNRQSLVMDGVTFSITIGVARFVTGEHFETALAQADAALYESKQTRS